MGKGRQTCTIFERGSCGFAAEGRGRSWRWWWRSTQAMLFILLLLPSCNIPACGGTTPLALHCFYILLLLLLLCTIAKLSHRRVGVIQSLFIRHSPHSLIIPSHLADVFIMTSVTAAATTSTTTALPPLLLSPLFIQVKLQVHPWIRLNRVIRDIPNQFSSSTDTQPTNQ